MSIAVRPVLLLACLTPLLASAREPETPGSVQYAQVMHRERVVIRIPRLALGANHKTDAAIAWDERKGPKCVEAATLASAAISPSGDVDLIVTDGRRLRAKLDDNCPTLNFYAGFYLRGTADGMVCAKRDALRSRSGARCEISRFRTLAAKK